MGPKEGVVAVHPWYRARQVSRSLCEVPAGEFPLEKNLDDFFPSATSLCLPEDMDLDKTDFLFETKEKFGADNVCCTLFGGVGNFSTEKRLHDAISEIMSPCRSRQQGYDINRCGAP